MGRRDALASDDGRTVDDGTATAPIIDVRRPRVMARLRTVASDGARRRPAAVQPEEVPEAPDLLSASRALRARLGAISVPLELDGAQVARRERESMINQLDDYLLPRLHRPDAPLLAVIGGSTGAGKSTLTNSLVRREVSRSGVLRPTTRSPVLVHHPADSGAFLSQRILPRLTRVTSEAPEPAQPIDPDAPRITGLRLVPHDGLTPGLGFVDAPDIDSLVETNRELAVQLLGAADLWIFVTTAARYADAAPWDMLQQASDRGVAVAVVLDRVPTASLQELRVHLATRLKDRGLGGAPMFTIPETEIVGGLLPQEYVTPIQSWLARIAGNTRARRVIADRSLGGVAASLPERARSLADAARRQAVGAAELQRVVRQVFVEVQPQLLTSVTDGSLLGGEVLARWQEFMADGEFLRRLDPGSTAAGEGQSSLAAPVRDALAAAIRAAVRSGRDQVLRTWADLPGGAALVGARAGQLPPLARLAEVERTVRDWTDVLQGRIEEAVRQASAEGRSVDVLAALDVIVVGALDQASDRSRRAGGGPRATVAAARRILATLLGEDRLQALVTDSRADLAARAADQVDQEAQRLEALLDVASIDPGRADGVLAAAALVAAALRAVNERSSGPS